MCTNISWIVGKLGVIYKSNNYGDEWVKSQVVFLMIIIMMFFLLMNLQAGVVSSYGAILKTVDGGNTWNEKNSGVNFSLSSIFFIDNNVGWVAGGPGTIIKSTDGGESWIAQTSGTNNWLEDIYLINDQVGFVVGSHETIIKTTNGGTSWQQVYSNNIWNSFSSVHFIQTNIGWVCAANESNWERLVLKTTNGGTTWTLQLTGSYF